MKQTYEIPQKLLQSGIISFSMTQTEYQEVLISVLSFAGFRFDISDEVLALHLKAIMNLVKVSKKGA